ncbi:hypothetical protein U3516DRAFT_655538 [Neocallimastix sp. 'constans']
MENSTPSPLQQQQQQQLLLLLLLIFQFQPQLLLYFQLLITTSNKSEAVTIEDINDSSIANSIWLKDSSNNMVCSYASDDKILLQQCDKNNKNQRWNSIDKDLISTPSTSATSSTTIRTTTTSRRSTTTTTRKTTTTTTTTTIRTSSTTRKQVLINKELVVQNTE